MVDLIHSLTADLGTTPDKAQVIAGRLLAWIERRLRARFGEEAAVLFAGRLPGLPPWRTIGPAPTAEVDFDELVAGTGLDPINAGIAVPAIEVYLRSRLPSDVLRLVLDVAPFLVSAGPERRPRPMAGTDATTYAPD